MRVAALLVAAVLPTFATAIPLPHDPVPAPAPPPVCGRADARAPGVRVADACMEKCGIEHRRCKASSADDGACADAYVACMEAC